MRGVLTDLPLTADVPPVIALLRSGPWHKVAALQPAAREARTERSRSRSREDSDSAVKKLVGGMEVSSTSPRIGLPVNDTAAVVPERVIEDRRARGCVQFSGPEPQYQIHLRSQRQKEQ
jgi:hypothetical protein